MSRWQTSTTVATVLFAAVAITISRYNIPYTLLSAILLHVAPLKERYYPSDSVSLSAETRGVAWFLNAGPPIPHDVGRVRWVLEKFWPRVWDGLEIEGVEVVVVPMQVREAGGAVVYSRDGSAELRRALLFQPAEPSTPSTKEDGGGGGGGAPAVVFVHGGGLIAGTPRSEFGVSAELARRCSCPVLSVDYRTLPEATAADAVSDVVAAFDWTVRKFPERRVSIIGASAGGGLTLLAGIALRDRARLASRTNKTHSSFQEDGRGEAAHEKRRGPDAPPLPLQPASLGMLSPGPGLEFLSDPPEVAWPSLATNADRDGFMKGEFYQYVRRLVFDYKTNRLYFWSALKDLSDLPPCLVTVGGYEVMLDGVRALRDALKGAGTEVEYREYEKLQHAHHVLFFVSKESSEGLDNIVSWLRDAY